MKPMKKVCIIGAGASGLTAIKCCNDEGLGWNRFALKKSYDIGGLWRYEDNAKDGACVYNSTVINTSKEMMCYSDFPIPKEYPNYMHNVKIMEYFRSYAERFNLLKHITFNTSVVSCEPMDNGQWTIKTCDEKTKEEKEIIFDAVLVCIGHHAQPYYPLDAFPGIESFGGEYFHSHEYRKPHGFDGKRVLVIGVGNSGGDLAVEISRHAKQLFLSTRRGCWVLNRVSGNGMPLDITLTSRATMLAGNYLPSRFINYVAEKQMNSRFDHEMYGLKPKHRFTGQHPTVNDEIPNCILCGRITVVKNVTKFNKTQAVFEDGRTEDIDVVIFATGYRFNYPFLSESILKVENNSCRLYKHMWPSTVENNTLAFIGGIQPLGAINPISEIQCRWALRVFKGLNVLPSVKERESSIDEQISEMSELYYKSPRHTIQVNYVLYMDDIASQIQVKPNFIKLLADPKLFLKVLFGPCTPYQYRLHGVGKWKEARHMILTLKDRVRYPLTRKQQQKESGLPIGFIVFILIISILFYFLY
ncbi:flavin-containing monooxygenase 5-like [Ciona intestinalis]